MIVCSQVVHLLFVSFLLISDLLPTGREIQVIIIMAIAIFPEKRMNVNASLKVQVTF